jgi:hypothetical protein
MGHIWEKNKKKKIFFPFCMDLYHKSLVWVIFWRKLKKKNFCVSIWTYTIRYSMGHILEKIKKKFFWGFLYGLILQGYSMGHIWEKIKKKKTNFFGVSVFTYTIGL